jgi:hypothetical protein
VSWNHTFNATNWVISDPVEYASKDCLGSSRTRNDTSLCSRHVMCPKCEKRRASKRAWGLNNRLKSEIEMAEDEGSNLKVGVLTTTLPGQYHSSGIRHQNLRSQYDYLTSRTNLKGLGGAKSMRGLNHVLSQNGIHAGCHNVEFTYNEDKSWWNVHNHSILIADEESWSGFLTETKDRVWESSDLLDRFELTHGISQGLETAHGLGRRYTLDWAEPSEFEQSIRYASKVAYMTKPIKAPRAKRLELSKFFNGFGGSYPRLSRPFGMWMRSLALP